MALPETSEHPEKKPSDPQKGGDRKEKLLSKVVIRRLPPSMDKDTFLNQISPVPPYDYFYLVRGDASLGENSFARAYINFTNPNDIYDFKEKFDNYVFLDNAGHEYPAVVEFSAFQKIPKRRNKVRMDPKVASIESDPYYLEFVEMLNKPLELEEKPEYSYQITTENKLDTMTPLLEFIKNKRAEKMRIREERREERKRKEFERKKFREDERKKRFDEKSPVKGKYTKVASPKEKDGDSKDAEKGEAEDVDKAKATDEKTPEKEDGDKHEKPAYYKGKKYDDKKRESKGKYPPKKEYAEKREYKNRRDDYKERDYRSKYEDYKKDDGKVFPKKVKKYSEKREERKIEAQKAEQQKKLEQQALHPTSKTEDGEDKSQAGAIKKEEEKPSPNKDTGTSPEASGKPRSKESESKSEAQKRIRNKDRPTIAIYRPGMLSKRKQVDGEGDTKEGKEGKKD